MPAAFHVRHGGTAARGFLRPLLCAAPLLGPSTLEDTHVEHRVKRDGVKDLGVDRRPRCLESPQTSHKHWLLPLPFARRQLRKCRRGRESANRTPWRDKIN